MKKRIQHITLVLILLLLGGAMNEAWADVTYIILTKPFNVRNAANTDNYHSDIRLEALRCTSTGTTVYLPDAFRSPAAKDFKYWKTPTVTTNQKLYDDTGTNPKVLQTTYDIYSDVADPMTESTTLAANGNPTVIYVTYDYDEDNPILKLDGAHKYNITLNSGDKLRYLCFNKNRGNRPAAALATTVTAEDLISNDFVQNVNGFDGTRMVHYQFYLCGQDPYNITIMTAYNGNETYMEDLNVEKGKKYKKPYRGSTIFAKLQNNNNNDGTANMWLSPDAHKHYKSTTNENDYDPWEGFYRSDMNPIFNAVAVLPKGTGYFFVASKLNQNGTIYQPNSSGYYATLSDDGKNPRMLFKAIESYVPMEPDPIRTYTFNVKTAFGNTVSATAEWSDAYKDAEITTSHVPESLRRKYCSYVGFYKDAELTEAITKYSDVSASGNIYIKYEVSGAPFIAISPSADYTTATWYELTDKDSSGKKIKWDATNTVYKNSGEANEHNKESEFAFIGDPYELRIINRTLTETNSRNFYVGSSSQSSGSNLTNFDSSTGSETDGFKWEIPYDELVGFTLREFKSTNAYWKWTVDGGNNNITYTQIEAPATPTRVKVIELPKYTYTYNVVDLAGNIAIKAEVEQPIFTPISGFPSIPAIIRSPFLADESITYYSTFSAGTFSDEIHETLSSAANIYIKYTTTRLPSKTINLSEGQSFNVKLNGEYIYWDSTNGVISKKTPTSDELASNAYIWELRGQDPYAMKIFNMEKNEYVTASWINNQSLSFDPDASDASRFIAMLSSYAGVYEVLAATGNSDLYHIGRASTEGAETKIYSIDTESGGYAYGADQLRFELFGTTTITYTLIDKAKKELLTVTSKNPRLALPSEYQSPLVGTYYYYPTKAKAEADNHENNITEIANDTNESDLTPADNHVWVTYTVNDNVKFNTNSSTKNNPYLLRFKNGKSYRLEDGSDKLTTGAKIQAMYPYCNGDGNLNVYGDRMREEQMGGGTSTRSRWQWFFESANSDPYHVKIHSNNTVTTRLGSDFTYLNTCAVKFKQESATPNKQRIVTGATLPGVWNAATEYMILGTAGNYKLLTTQPVAADLDGDGNTTDEGENERRYVTSFEQYWKTYNMVKQHVLGLNHDDPKKDPYDDEFSEDPSTFVIPDEYRATLKTKLGSGDGNFDINDFEDLNYVDGSSWHSYVTIASAIRWNGYGSTESGHKTRVVEELEHWFQTFDMGDGSFDIENGDIPPVLVLLDRHGWEIMRKSIPTGSSDAEADTKLAALKAFDSPMVKAYKFYSQATKASGCHKYTLRTNSSGYRDEIKVGGVQFTSTSLGTLPPYVPGRDLFVTYTVKEEYEKSYDPSTSTASRFIVLQNHQYAQDASSTLTAVNAPSNLSNEIIADALKDENDKTFKSECLWFVQPNSKIDDEMGYPGETITTYTNDDNGFDPYNLQLKNASTDKFFTIDMKKSILDDGVYTGVYDDPNNPDDAPYFTVILAAKNESPVESTESYDHSTLKMTNQTFMAVQDVNGNMQLMPRFDHSRRINAFTALAEPLTNATKAAVDDGTPGAQTTFLVRPQVFDYKVIDNQGNVALRYQTGGEFYPSMPEHFKSPLADNFKFYKTLTDGVASDEITSSFAASGITADNADIYIRYGYNDTYDTDNQNILQGQWLTMSLDGKDVQARGELSTTDGTGVSLYTGTKDATKHEWQWKFLQSRVASSSPLYLAPDPYCVTIQNRNANNGDPTATPSKMATAIKVSGKDRFVILSHPSGDYALCAAGDGLTYSFLNGGSMTVSDAGTPVAASVESEGGFTKASNTISDDARIIFTEDVTHTYTYRIINNSNKLAASDTQYYSTAQSNEFKPVVPYNIQSPLINDADYIYYGNVDINNNGTAEDPSDDTYTEDNRFVIDNLYGLYEDVVYVRYPAFSRDNTPYMVPNARTTVDSHVAKDANSNDVTVDINGNLPYNIIWYNDNMMSSTDNTNIIDKGSNDLSAVNADMWYLEGEGGENPDPYAIKIRHHGGGHYVNGNQTLVDKNVTSPKTYMLLKRADYDYGVLAETGNKANMLTFGDHDSNNGTPYTLFTTTDAPAKFIPFALSVHHLIYHLVINTSKLTTNIPYRSGDEDSYQTSGEWSDQVTPISGTTQRDLILGSPAGATYQLGETVYFQKDETTAQTYCYDAGKVSLGDVLEVPGELKRPNCRYYYYVQDIYDSFNTAYNASDGSNTGGTDKRCEGLNPTLNNKYKGLKMDENTPRLIKKADLIGKTVVINITYSFDTGLPTNAGEGFVTDVTDNYWYTFETTDATPYLAHFTYKDAKLSAVAGRATHYTNDFLWSPLGDPYGFKMYNRYVYKNGGEETSVMTTASIGADQDIVMGATASNDNRDIYELLESGTTGSFMVHPMKNMESTKYYLNNNSGTLKLSTAATLWTYGLSEELMRPYYFAAGYVGGLTTTPETGGKALYEAAAAEENDALRVRKLQMVVYNDDNIVKYAPGYYRLHSQPGASGISPVRYASGYLHDIEKTAGAESTAIPMHFYSRIGVNTTFAGEGGLASDFTETAATRGEIPVPATEYDPSSIFYFNGAATANPTSTISTQDLKVDQNKMTTGAGTTYHITDIGGAVVVLHDGNATIASRKYLNYNQASDIYDLKYSETGIGDNAKWCMEPANVQGLLIETHSGGDSYYYTTFCAPYDVILPNDEKTYAYVCTAWNEDIIHPTKVPSNGPIAEGKFVSAGTPVIIRTSDTSGSVKVSLAGTASSATSCVFTGKYLEQLLATPITTTDKVYTFGLPITGYNLTIDDAGGFENGEVDNVNSGSDPAYTGVGFYLNATRNKEKNALSAQWTPNNRYVLHNKIYYRSTEASGSSARQNTRGVEFVPVIFDDEESEPELFGIKEENRRVYDNRVYDLQGRCVATEEQVKDGTWRQNLRPGIYIINGRKIRL